MNRLVKSSFFIALLLFANGCSLPEISFIVINKTSQQILVYFKYDALQKDGIFEFHFFSPSVCSYEIEGKNLKTIECDNTLENWKIDTVEQSFVVRLESEKFVTIGSKRQPYDKDPNSQDYERFNLEKLKISVNDSSFIEANHGLAENLFRRIDKLTYGLEIN